MPKSRAIIRAGTLIVDTSNGGQHLEIPAGSDAWFTWLQTARTFVFDDPGGRFTARKKRRSRVDYWYGFRRHGGRLYETYLGKARDVTLERLRAAAAKLNERAGWSVPADTQPPALVQPEPNDGFTQSIAQSSALKVNPPRVQLSRLVRTRAVERLEQVTACPLTIVSAPAGYGKTTLISQWVATSHIPVAWLALDELANNPSWFWSLVCAALAQFVPGFMEVVSRLAEVPVSRRGNVMLAALVAALAQVPSPILLVLDDYHAIRPDNTAVHESVAYFVEQLPSHVHVVVASRTIPPFPLARLRFDRQLVELYAEDLQFTLAETSAFLSDYVHVDLSAEEVAVLHARTEGWVAGLKLAALSLQEQPDIATWIDVFNGENRHIFDYLVEEVLNRLPSELQTFLLQIGLLERFTASLCNAVTRASNSQTILDGFERANLFVVSLDGRREWYRFHHLFADVLRRYARMTQPTLVPKLYTRASRWCESHGLPREAIDYAFAANKLPRAAGLIEGYIPVALAKDQRALLLEKLERLPDSIVRQRPHLCAAHAYTLFMTGGDRERMRQRIRDGEESVERTEHLFTRADLAILRSELLALRTSIQFMLPADMEPRALVSLHQQALAGLPRHHWLRNFTTLFIGMEQLLDGDVGASVHTLDALMRASEAHSDLFYVAISSLYLGLALLQQGRLDDALARSGRAAQLLKGYADSAWIARIYMISGKVFYERNELAQALDCLRQGIALVFDPAPFLFEGYPALAYVHLALGEPTAARQAIEQSLAVWTQSHADNMMMWAWTGALVRAHQARLWLLDGDVGAASAWARALERDRQAATGSEIGPSTYVREWEDIVLARVYLGEQRAHDALALLSELGEAANADGRRSRLLEILVLRVVAYEALGNTPAAMLALERAVELGASQRFVRTFVEGGHSVGQLLMMLRAERMRHGARTRRETALLRYTEILVAAFEPQGYGDQHKRSGRAAAAPISDSMLVPLVPKLTQRERQILRLLADGSTNREIAAALVISEATVKRHVSNILMALHARNRTQAVMRARELGLLNSLETNGSLAHTGRGAIEAPPRESRHRRAGTPRPRW